MVHFSLHTHRLQPQVENMTSKWHVYMTMDGRISMAGLSGGCAQGTVYKCCTGLRTALHGCCWWRVGCAL